MLPGRDVQRANRCMKSVMQVDTICVAVPGPAVEGPDSYNSTVVWVVGRLKHVMVHESGALIPSGRIDCASVLRQLGQA